jgi:hypothetical protein
MPAKLGPSLLVDDPIPETAADRERPTQPGPES